MVASATTALLLRGMMSEQAQLRDLGEHRLKDLVDPERVWQLLAPGLIESFPPLQSLNSLPNNLPRQLTPLIGRDDVLAEVEPLVLEHPLVSLVGTVASARRASHCKSVRTCSTAPATVLALELATSSDAALGSSMPLHQPSVTRARRSLDLERARTLPQVSPAAVDPRELRTPYRRGGARRRSDPAHCAASSSSRNDREPTLIPPSALPRAVASRPPEDPRTAEDALQYGAIAFSVERARASDATFALSDENAPVVAEICRRLDGIALAIELAAARVKMTSPRSPRRSSMSDSACSPAATGRRRHASRRCAHSTAGATIFCRSRSRSLPLRLDLCRGWSLAAAETVWTEQTLDAPFVIDLTSSLVEKSLVVAGVEQDTTRHRSLESTRAFSLEKLEQSGERDAGARCTVAADLAHLAYEVRGSTG